MSAQQVNIKFNADTSALNTGVNRAKQVLGGLKSSIASTFAAVGAGAIVKSILSEFDRLSKLASRFDISVETMQRLGRVASLAGADVEELSSAMVKATKAGQDAAGGNQKIADAFATLNIDVKKFNNASLEEKLAMIADGFNGAATEGEGMAALLAVMGRSAANLIPLLREGSEGLTEQMSGMTVASQEAVQAIERFNDALEELIANTKAPLAEFLGSSIEKLNQFADGFRMLSARAALTFGFLKDGGKDILAGNGLENIRDIAEDWGSRYDFIEQEIVKRAAGIQAKAAGGKNKPAPMSPYEQFLDFVGSDPSLAGVKNLEGSPSPPNQQTMRSWLASFAMEELNRDFIESAFGDSYKAIEAGIEEARQKRDGLQDSIVADSLASIGATGGGVFATKNPMVAKMDQQIKFLSDQLKTLEGIEANTKKQFKLR